MGREQHSSRGRVVKYSAYFCRVALLTTIALSIATLTFAVHSATTFKWSQPYGDIDLYYYPTDSLWRTPLAAAMTTWNNAGSRFRFRSSSSRNYIYFDSLPPNAPTSAHTYPSFWNLSVIGSANIVMNSRVVWSNSGNSAAFDVQNVLTHELGHWLRLSDLFNSSDSHLTMYGYVDPGETKKRSLETDDIIAIRSMYP
jgi:hypothetical protein